MEGLFLKKGALTGVAKRADAASYKASLTARSLFLAEKSTSVSTISIDANTREKPYGKGAAPK
jgi:hypothetical protein